MFQRITPIFLLFALFAFDSALAEPEPPDEKAQEASKHERRSLKEYIVDQHDAAAKAVDSASNKIDMYLSGQKLSKEKNKSTLVFKNGIFWSEGGEFDESFHVDFKLHLPNLEEKWALRFTSYDDDDDERGINRRRIKSGPREENYGTSVALFKKLGDIDVTFKPKVQFRDTVETSHLIRLESKAEMKHFNIRPKLELFARSDTGTGELFALEFDYKINDTYTLYLADEQEYVDKDNRFSTNHELALGQTLSETQSMRYATLFESHDKPAFHLARYTFYISYGHALYKNMLHYGVTSSLAFAEEQRFSGAAGLSVGVDFIF